MFFFNREKVNRKDAVFVIIVTLVTTGLFFLPSGFENEIYKSSVRTKALVLSTDDSLVKQYGIVKQGNQSLRLRVLRGPFKGNEYEADNMIIGKIELDKLFRPGDAALTVIDLDPATGKVVNVTALDHYRLDAEMILFGVFIVLLLLYSGWTGMKAVVSFVFSVAMIWKVMIPSFLWGLDPILSSLAVVCLLTFAIIFLIGGFTRKGLVAFAGAFAGIVATCVVALASGAGFHVNGAVRPFSEMLLYAGFPHLDLRKILLAGIFLASSGAVMDLAMDIASAMQEVRDHHPELGRRGLVMSGFRVGRSVIGTMTTTLLLAYSGGYTSLLMVFLAQGIPAANMFNLSYVSAEILHTLVGSFGLILVAPFTALAGGFIFSGKKSGVAA